MYLISLVLQSIKPLRMPRRERNKFVKKNQVLELKIEDYAFGGKGIARIKSEEGSFVVFVPNKFRVTGRHRFGFQGLPLLRQKSVKRDKKAGIGSIFQVNPLSASIVSRMIGWNSAGIPSWRLRTHFDPSFAHLWHDMGRGIHLPGSRAGTGHGHEDPEGGELAKRPAKTV